MSETAVTQAIAKVEVLQSNLEQLQHELVAHRSAVDLLTMDCKSLNTSLQNTLMSFGALKEKTDTVFSSMALMSGDKDSKISRVDDDSKQRLTDCQKLCGERAAALIFKVDTVQTLIAKDLAAVVAKQEIVDKDVDARITAIESKINWTIGTALSAFGLLVLWAIKVVVQNPALLQDLFK